MSLSIYEYLKEELPEKSEEDLKRIVYTLERIQTRRSFQDLLKYNQKMDVAYKKLKEFVDKRVESLPPKTYEMSLTILNEQLGNGVVIGAQG